MDPSRLPRSTLCPQMLTLISPKETCPVSEKVRFLVFRIPDDGQSPETQRFWVFLLVFKTLYREL
jgi:hypothetical protein